MKFMAMKPEVGMGGGYATENCSLKVEVISYDESNSIRRVGLRVTKKLNDNLKCHYDEGDEFFLEGNLEGLVLDWGFNAIKFKY